MTGDTSHRQAPTDRPGRMAYYDRLRLEELESIADFLRQCGPEQWDHPSLCAGWRVRDVVGHICVGYTTPMPTLVAKLARRGFNVTRASRDESIVFASEHSTDELLDVFTSIYLERIRRGITRLSKPPENLVDHVIHHQDMRRPLGIPRTVPEERLVAALDVVPTLGGLVASKQRVAGLALVATDVDWSSGDGPQVVGPGEALLLAASGRAVALGDLQGEGLGTLRSRLAA